MREQLRQRFRAEVMLAALALIAGSATAIWPDWIEVVLGADPDHGSGAVELAIVVGLAVVSVAAAWAARATHHRLAANPVGDHMT